MEAFEFLESQRETIEALCRKYSVKALRVFGSSVRGDWRPEDSDFDFVVEFWPPPLGMGPSDQYFDFKIDLESALGRNADLIEWKAAKNPFFVREIERTAVGYYAS
jgi:uncharacterized protein